jgi:hypothetical protein
MIIGRRMYSPDAHCNEYTAQRPRSFPAPQSGAVKSILAFRRHIVILIHAES